MPYTKEELSNVNFYNDFIDKLRGNYFMLDLNGYQPERFYRLEFRVRSGSGVDELDQYFNEGFTFKVSQ